VVVRYEGNCSAERVEPLEAPRTRFISYHCRVKKKKSQIMGVHIYLGPTPAQRRPKTAPTTPQRVPPGFASQLLPSGLGRRVASMAYATLATPIVAAGREEATHCPCCRERPQSGHLRAREDQSTDRCDCPSPQQPPLPFSVRVSMLPLQPRPPPKKNGAGYGYARNPSSPPTPWRAFPSRLGTTFWAT
jgi:hypothetical protein